MNNNPLGNPASLPTRKPGRPRGAQSKVPMKIRKMIFDAVEAEGGVDLIRTWLRTEPVAAMRLLGQILPRQHDIDATVQANHHHSSDITDALLAGRQRIAAMRAQTVMVEVQQESEPEALGHVPA
jgi:hypothetical protein